MKLITDTIIYLTLIAAIFFALRIAYDPVQYHASKIAEYHEIMAEINATKYGVQR